MFFWGNKQINVNKTWSLKININHTNDLIFILTAIKHVKTILIFIFKEYKYIKINF